MMDGELRSNDRTDGEMLELVEELQLSEETEVANVRVRDAVPVRAAVEIAPGNASDRRIGKVVGETREISRENLRLCSASPLPVGDVFVIQFDRDAVPLPESFALVHACRMVSPSLFESELRFFAPVYVERLPRAES